MDFLEKRKIELSKEKEDIFLKARKNSSNGQINFQLNKRAIPNKFKDKIPEIKGIKIKFEDFKF